MFNSRMMPLLAASVAMMIGDRGYIEEEIEMTPEQKEQARRAGQEAHERLEKAYREQREKRWAEYEKAAAQVRAERQARKAASFVKQQKRRV